MPPARSWCLILPLFLSCSSLSVAQSRAAKSTGQRPSVLQSTQQVTSTATKFLNAIQKRDFAKWAECLSGYEYDLRLVRIMNPRVLWADRSEAVKRRYQDFFESRFRAQTPIELESPFEDYIAMDDRLLYVLESAYRVLETRADRSGSTVYVELEYKPNCVIVGGRGVRSLIVSFFLHREKLEGRVSPATEYSPASLNLPISVVPASLKFFPK